LLIVPFTLSFSINVIGFVLTMPGIIALAWARSVRASINQITDWPFPISVFNLAGNLAMFSVIAVLVLRYARSRRDEERFEAELEAARAVQQVSIPEKIPSVLGYRVDCVYKPAGQVGGDFFQIIPLQDGNALVAIGDVSGKGMPAAMTVSMVVGMVRILARTTQSPAAILATMNQNMIDRAFGGFTTCLILHMSQDGLVTAANAGHIAPYLGGHEMPVANGLPLGLTPAATYAESAHQLSPDDQLTLLTDGVLEARKADGELFGFARTALVSALPVDEIAQAAEHFGQRDDITVLSLIRQPFQQKSNGPVESAAWSKATA
jgi:serine phosphatase RsbU (regulator of sigma subunit)